MTGMVIWAVLLTLVACVWTSRHGAINRARTKFPPLTAETFPGPVADPPLVSVLVAAKDEEANIESAVRTLLDQDYPNYELIVIDDRSSDRTAEILESIKAERADDKLKVIHIKQLEEGWFGKNNAMREGVAQAKGDWLCFGDADCRQTSDRTITTAMHEVLTHKIDFLSLLPRLETHSVWERIIQPVCGAVMVFWFNPEKVNDPQHSAAYANGAFMLMTRSCYEAIGGHEAVRTEVNEDMKMARLAKEHNQRLYMVQNEGLYCVRMYSGFPEIWRGWSRIFYGCFGTFRRLRVTMLMLLCTNVFPYTSLVIAAAVLLAEGWATAGTGWHWVAAASALAVFMQQTVIARYYKVSQTNPIWAPTFIIGAFICIGMLINAMMKLGGRTQTTWRGTTYRDNKVVQTQSP